MAKDLLVDAIMKKMTDVKKIGGGIDFLERSRRSGWVDEAEAGVVGRRKRKRREVAKS